MNHEWFWALLLPFLILFLFALKLILFVRSKPATISVTGLGVSLKITYQEDRKDDVH